MDNNRFLNKKFGNWLVTGVFKRPTKNGKHHTIWCHCICVCGKKSDVYYHNLEKGYSKSCGCSKPKQKEGKNSPSWKGGRRIESGGYVEIYNKEHPRSRQNGYVKEHILVMEKSLGRYLIKGENVHHINGDKTDNRIENLELWNTSQPCGQRVKDKLIWAKQIIKLYE